MAIMLQLFKGNEERVVEKATRILKKGGTIIFPTESSYGLGADASNATAVKKVWAVKQQPATKQISIIVADLEQAKKFGKLDEKAEKIAQKLMPGPITLVVQKQPSVPNELSEGTIAFRIPSHPIARALCKRLGSAITATSANMHNRPSIYSAKEVIKQFNNRVILIIDAGELPHNAPSTIYDVATEQILRRGPIDETLIKNALES